MCTCTKTLGMLHKPASCFSSIIDQVVTSNYITHYKSAMFFLPCFVLVLKSEKINNAYIFICLYFHFICRLCFCTTGDCLVTIHQYWYQIALLKICTTLLKIGVKIQMTGCRETISQELKVFYWQ